MLCKFLLTMLLLVNILLSTAHSVQRIDPRHKPKRVFCNVNVKASQMASKAAKEAKDAKDALPKAASAAGQRAKVILADRAMQASKSAEVVLSGKRQVLAELTKSLSETRRVIEEIKRAIASSTCSMKQAQRIQAHVQRTVANMQCLFKEMTAALGNFQRVAQGAQREALEKRSLLEAAKRRLDELHECMERAQKDLNRNRENAKKANAAACEAKQRVNTLRKLVSKIRSLKRKDIHRLQRLLRRTH